MHAIQQGAPTELNGDAVMTCYMTMFSKTLPSSCRLPSSLFPRLLLSLRLEDCSSDVPLLPREVLVFLSTKLWDSTTHLSSNGEHSASTPHPLLLIKFFIIVCR